MFWRVLVSPSHNKQSHRYSMDRQFFKWNTIPFYVEIYRPDYDDPALEYRQSELSASSADNSSTIFSSLWMCDWFEVYNSSISLSLSFHLLRLFLAFSVLRILKMSFFSASERFFKFMLLFCLDDIIMTLVLLRISEKLQTDHPKSLCLKSMSSWVLDCKMKSWWGRLCNCRFLVTLSIEALSCFTKSS